MMLSEKPLWMGNCINQLVLGEKLSPLVAEILSQRWGAGRLMGYTYIRSYIYNIIYMYIHYIYIILYYIIYYIIYYRIYYIIYYISYYIFYIIYNMI